MLRANQDLNRNDFQNLKLEISSILKDFNDNTERNLESVQVNNFSIIFYNH